MDSGSNWADGISRDLDQDQVSRQLGFHPAEIEAGTDWWQADWLEVWHRVKSMVA